MIGLLATVLPLDLASALSPGIFALAIILLGSKSQPKLRTLALLAGTIITGILVAILGFALGQSTPASMHLSAASAIIDTSLGAIFIAFAFVTLFAKDRSAYKQEDNEGHLWKWMLLGLAVSITNLDAVFLCFTAAKQISDAHSIDIAIRLILLVISILFFILPITLPLFVDLLFPKIALPFLTKINIWVLKYSKYILFTIFIIFGIVLAYNGLKYFI